MANRIGPLNDIRTVPVLRLVTASIQENPQSCTPCEIFVGTPAVGVPSNDVILGIFRPARYHPASSLLHLLGNTLFMFGSSSGALLWLD